MDTKKIAEKLVTAYTDPEVAATEIAAQVARLQQERFELLNELGEKVRVLGVNSAVSESALRDLVRRNPKVAAVVIEIFKKQKVNIGELESRLVDELEDAAEVPLYPPKWSHHKAKWGIVSGE